MGTRWYKLCGKFPRAPGPPPQVVRVGGFGGSLPTEPEERGRARSLLESSLLVHPFFSPVAGLDWFSGESPIPQRAWIGDGRSTEWLWAKSEVLSQGSWPPPSVSVSMVGVGARGVNLHLRRIWARDSCPHQPTRCVRTMDRTVPSLPPSPAMQV